MRGKGDNYGTRQQGNANNRQGYQNRNRNFGVRSNNQGPNRHFKTNPK